MRKLILGFIAGAALASAGTIDSNTVAFNLAATGLPTNTTTAQPSDTLISQFQQFNPALGTLTGVAYVVTYSQNMEIEAQVISNSAVPVSGNFGDFVVFETTGVPQFSLGSLQGTVGCTPSTELNLCDQTATKSQGPIVIDTAISNINGYTGLSTVPFQVETIGEIAATAGVIGPNLFFDSTGLTGNIFLQYTYTAPVASTPEPGSLALLGTGFGLLALLRYRRK
ncbi:MAG: choice-of-anchor E domain-containing protein [Bryobacteraceae bacterium]